MPSQVNLDALIVREDFDAEVQGEEALTKHSIEVRELDRTELFFLGLRKPDFQRETSEWDPARVVGLIKTFVEGQLIPAVILWRNRDLTYVIDGSHRLSALISWVQDDYGDGPKSQDFFGHSISEEQKKAAEKTRTDVEREIGSYKQHRDAALDPSKYGPDLVTRARRLATTSLQLQWVRGDAVKAEESFVRINQQAAQITPQELELIQKRKKPNAIAARAIIQKGAGHKYWSSFPTKRQKEIRELATDLNSLFFEPRITYPIKSADLPLGGNAYAATALRMIFDFVNACSGVPSPDDDIDGSRTVQNLNQARRVARLLLSNHPSSLGLHPAVYFYSWTGKQEPIMLLTITQLIVKMERSKELPAFTKVRGDFEAFLMHNRTLLNQIIRKFGTKGSGAKHLANFYADVLDRLREGIAPTDVVRAMMGDGNKYSYLQPNETPYGGVNPTRYSTQVKSGLVMEKLLSQAMRCGICNGVVASQAMSIDHIERRQDGGLATGENAQVTHPYCNTGYKEGEHARSLREVEARQAEHANSEPSVSGDLFDEAEKQASFVAPLPATLHTPAQAVEEKTKKTRKPRLTSP